MSCSLGASGDYPSSSQATADILAASMPREAPPFSEDLLPAALLLQQVINAACHPCNSLFVLEVTLGFRADNQPPIKCPRNRSKDRTDSWVCA
eukprot:1505922-Amphidinium_carterae.1